MMDDNPFRPEMEARRAQRQMQRITEAQQQAVADYEHAKGARDYRRYQADAEHYMQGSGVLQQDRTSATLDAMLHAIDGLRETVKQMNAALVEIRKLIAPKIVEFPSNALKHSDPGWTRIGGGMVKY